MCKEGLYMKSTNNEYNFQNSHTGSKTSNLFSLLLQNKICAYCLLRLGNATTIRSDGTMIHIMCDVHHSTMGDVVVTKTTSVQCKTVSDAVKVGTTHLDLKKSLEQVRLLTLGPVDMCISTCTLSC